MSDVPLREPLSTTKDPVNANDMVHFNEKFNDLVKENAALSLAVSELTKTNEQCGDKLRQFQEENALLKEQIDEQNRELRQFRSLWKVVDSDPDDSNDSANKSWPSSIVLNEKPKSKKANLLAALKRKVKKSSNVNQYHNIKDRKKRNKEKRRKMEASKEIIKLRRKSHKLEALACDLAEQLGEKETQTAQLKNVIKLLEAEKNTTDTIENPVDLRDIPL